METQQTKFLDRLSVAKIPLSTLKLLNFLKNYDAVVIYLNNRISKHLHKLVAFNLIYAKQVDDFGRYLIVKKFNRLEVISVGKKYAKVMYW